MRAGLEVGDASDTITSRRLDGNRPDRCPGPLAGNPGGAGATNPAADSRGAGGRGKELPRSGGGALSQRTERGA
eukprot:6309563-Alexandrium_andersonii.AAC.1